mgnify:CR=1 FL=1
MHHIIFPEKMIDKQLESDMDEVLKIVVFGRAARNTANIKNRQPIGTMYVKVPKVMDKYFTFPQKSGKKPLQLPGKCGTVHFDN